MAHESHIDSEEDRPLDTVGTAAFLGVSPRTVERWRLKRVGPPFFKLSARSIRYSLKALRAWRDAQTVVCD